MVFAQLGVVLARFLHIRLRSYPLRGFLLPLPSRNLEHLFLYSCIGPLRLWGCISGTFGHIPFVVFCSNSLEACSIDILEICAFYYSVEMAGQIDVFSMLASKDYWMAPTICCGRI